MTAALKVVTDPVASARAGVAHAEAEAQRAADELRLASEAESKATAAYDAEATEATETRAAKARLARERAERRHAAKLADVELARQALREQEQAEARKELARAIAFVQALPSRLAPHVRELVDIDRRVGEVVDRIADVIVEALDVHSRAQELAETLGTPAMVQTQTSKPTLGLAALMARIAIARDREKRKGDLANGWLEAASEPRWDSPERPAYDAAVTTVVQIEKELV